MQKYKKWDLLTQANPTTIEEIKNILFKNRNILNLDEQEKFLNPPDPEKIKLEEVNIDEKQVNKAIKRLEKAKKNKEHIVIYGDYDVDGVCSTAILWETLHMAEFNVMPFLPNRFRDGYGITPFSIQNLKEENKDLKLIITVDNGIVGHEALAEAKKLGIDMIITDHHSRDDKELDALAVIHSTYISGSGVSYFFSREIAKKYKLKKHNHIELAALGTVADQLPLTKQNRTLVWHGLKSMQNTKRKGLKKLIEHSGVSDQIGTYDINFKVAPRINAAGRLEEAVDALRLLCSANGTTINTQVQKLDELNSKRQKIVEEVLQKATQNLSKREDVVVVAAADLHEGVIGLAASKLTEVFYRPSIVISLNGEIGKASARSIKGFNIIEAIREIDDLIIQGGGHEMAAGFSIEKKNIEEFREKIVENAKSKLTADILESGLKIDTQIDFSLINWELIDLLEKFEPHGIGNPNAVFVSTECNVRDIKTVGAENKHLKFKVSKDKNEFDCIAFGKGDLIDQITMRETVNVAFNLEKNEWNGRKSIQFKIRDLN